MADLITATEYVQIDSLILATPAYRVVDVAVLWEAATQAGEDTIMPGTHGSRPNPRWRRPTSHTLEVHIFGGYDSTGAPVANARESLFQNLMALRALTLSPGGADGTRTLTVRHASGSTITGPAHVVGLTSAAHSPVWRIAALELSLPQGQLS